MMNHSPLFNNEHPSISLILNNISQRKIQDIKGFLESNSGANLAVFKEFIFERNQASSISVRHILCYEKVQQYRAAFVSTHGHLDTCKEAALSLVETYLLNGSALDIGIQDNSVLGPILRPLIEYIQPPVVIKKPTFGGTLSAHGTPSKPQASQNLFGNSTLDSGSLFDGILGSPNNTNNSNIATPNTPATPSSANVEIQVQSTPPPPPQLEFTSVIVQDLFESLNDYLLLKLDIDYKKYQNKEKEENNSNLNSSSGSAIDPLNFNQSQVSASLEVDSYTNSPISNMSASSSVSSSRGRPTYNLQLLEGEKIEVEPWPVYFMDVLYGESIPSTLFITSFRVLFLSKMSNSEIASMPLSTIYRVDRVSNFKVDHTISIWGKNFRRLDFFIVPREIYPNTAAEIYQSGDFTYPIIARIRNHAFQENFFAYKFKYNIPSSTVPLATDQNDQVADGWRVHDFFREFMRQGLLSQDENTNWRYSIANLEYFNPTYPKMLIVPKDISDDDIIKCMEFRSKQRIPALSWVSPSGVPMARSSQPMVGITRQKSSVDERLVSSIRQSCPSNKSLYLMDARPKANAIGNMAKGMGYELNYDCNIEFLGIANIHSMRESYNKLETFCQSNSDDNWLSGFEATKWWEYLRVLLQGTSRIVQLITNGHPVLLHCSDGWDRTSQLSSLAMIMLDPYYRTINGFQVLIEKEWLSFGHCFQNRIRHGDRNYYSESQRSPIFPQFIDCVFQLLHQHPEYFEFNDEYLIAILDALYSCQFGTFLCNSEKERNAIKSKTVSVWTYLNTIKDQFQNVFYQPEKSVPFNILDWKAEHIVLWKNYYQRYSKSLREPINYYKISVDLKLKLRQLEAQISDLKLILNNANQSPKPDNNNNSNDDDSKDTQLNHTSDQETEIPIPENSNETTTK